MVVDVCHLNIVDYHAVEMLYFHLHSVDQERSVYIIMFKKHHSSRDVYVCMDVAWFIAPIFQFCNTPLGVLFVDHCKAFT